MKFAIQTVDGLTRAILRQLKRFDGENHGCTRDNHQQCRAVATCIFDSEQHVLIETPMGLETQYYGNYINTGMERWYGEPGPLPRVVLLK